MNQEEFSQLLASEGFQEVVTVEREANGFLHDHSHPFEAKALILDGELRIRALGADQVYQPGQVFHLAADTPHSEVYGPAGVRYLVGRKH